MSEPHPNPQERPKPLIARFDDLFTENGIHFSADNPHLVLHIADAHSDVEPLSALPGNPLKGKPKLRFEGGEHTAIGDNTLLRLAENAEPIRAQNVPLHLPNGLALTYGQVLALGGDFYGVVDRPINEGATPARSPEPVQCRLRLPRSTLGLARRGHADSRGHAKRDRRG